jgi:hypothetical protein
MGEIRRTVLLKKVAELEGQLAALKAEIARQEAQPVPQRWQMQVTFHVNAPTAAQATSTVETSIKSGSLMWAQPELNNMRWWSGKPFPVPPAPAPAEE